MRKITVFIEGGEKTLSFDQSIVVDKTSTLFVKSASIFWNYDNVKKDVNDTVIYDGLYKTLRPGMWTFSMLNDEFEKYGTVVLEKRAYDGRCTLFSDKVFGLLDLGPLLGFPENAVVEPGDNETSPKQANILGGLRFVKIHWAFK